MKKIKMENYKRELIVGPIKTKLSSKNISMNGLLIVESNEKEKDSFKEFLRQMMAGTIATTCYDLKQMSSVWDIERIKSLHFDEEDCNQDSRYSNLFYYAPNNAKELRNLFKDACLIDKETVYKEMVKCNAGRMMPMINGFYDVQRKFTFSNISELTSLFIPNENDVRETEDKLFTDYSNYGMKDLTFNRLFANRLSRVHSFNGETSYVPPQMSYSYLLTEYNGNESLVLDLTIHGDSGKKNIKMISQAYPELKFHFGQFLLNNQIELPGLKARYGATDTEMKEAIEDLDCGLYLIQNGAVMKSLNYKDITLPQEAKNTTKQQAFIIALSTFGRTRVCNKCNCAFIAGMQYDKKTAIFKPKISNEVTKDKGIICPLCKEFTGNDFVYDSAFNEVVQEFPELLNTINGKFDYGIDNVNYDPEY